MLMKMFWKAMQLTRLINGLLRAGEMCGRYHLCSWTCLFEKKILKLININLHELVLERNPNSQSGAWSTSKPNTRSGVQRKSKPKSDTWYLDKQPKSSTLPLDGTHLKPTSWT